MGEYCFALNLEIGAQFRFGIDYLLTIKPLYGCYSDIFTINSFIQLLILLVSKTILVTTITIAI